MRNAGWPGGALAPSLSATRCAQEQRRRHPDPSPGERAAWLDAAHAALVEKFPRILAVVFFHSNSEHDWTLYEEPDALAAFRRMDLDPYFNPPPIDPRR